VKLGRADLASVLLAVVAVLSVLAVLGTRHAPTTSERDARAKNLLPVWQEDEVRHIDLRRGPETVTVDRAADGWNVRTPEPERADDAAVTKLVKGLALITPVRRLEGSDLETHGLKNPRATLALDMGSEHLVLSLGDDAPSPAGGAYVALDGAGSSRLGAVVTAEAAKLFATRTDDLRETGLVPYGERESRELVIERPQGRLDLVHGSALGFRLDGHERANRDALAPVFAALTHLSATRFLTLPAAERARGSAPVTRLTLQPSAKDDPSFILELGGDCPEAPAEIIAIERAPRVRAACTRADVLGPLSVEREALVDHNPFLARKDEVEALTLERDGRRLALERRGTAFSLREPSEAPVELEAGNRRLEALTRAAAELVPDPNLKALGLEPPHGKVTLRVITDDDKAAEEVVTLGKTAPDGTLYLRRSEDGGVLALGREAARAFAIDSTLLRSNKVLDFALSALAELELSAPEQQLVRRAPNGFTLVKPAGFGADGELTTDAVLALGSLTAVRWVADDDDGSFGLLTPTLTARARLDPSDAGPSERLLRVGRPTPGGYFAALDGSPGVFMLERSVEERLGKLLIDRSALMAEPGTLARVTLTTPKKTIVLERRGGELVAETADVPPAATALALEALSSLRAEGAIHSGPAHASEGLSTPALSVKLEPSPGLGKTRSFRIGAADTYGEEAVRDARADGVEATFAVAESKLRPLFDLF
jgi:Domain of unknown function (DUF4340)